MRYIAGNIQKQVMDRGHTLRYPSACLAKSSVNTPRIGLAGM